ncbi:MULTISPECIES: ABC transporter ATP-binding protein [Alloalcanivorax]|jgi:branched-chain amino acid transport system ATP-binding protein|uniref:ABC transporter ATP-binding protein n=2 Tax=Alloalcanivorax TaxID=3020832 RepID=A0A9Q3W303_9GAMM|nr:MULTISPECIES: ABC transporter ATP-binding protein [Alloalcanivorax]ERS15092.1 ABC transporter ATP-binding protein [Alcanivorax sp. PN-3]KYZ87160.1 ABC transporter ATP-binding protein [Alcanivorax sp. KX64203]MBA4721621.1 ABC transporter ATP-binding protein [Alcanivorax sp.]ARB45347.1 leucine/isoleucine/valine transporter ATP-binding subunit [Alloalcanivorax xenomutans]MCE7507606.1 ABC transporter ATP-binding protein [Alloalcanivorax xenomutans]|tara:strand:- start:224 stop:991 length:768 start_codon:yes stop_codon:yes gene_type:complete
MLKISNLTKRFGGLAAVNNVSVEFPANQVNAIIGPNGAGKSTFFNLVAGAMPPSEGKIEYQGMDITGMAPDRIARLGVARTFQTTMLFDQSTVLDNLIVGHRLRTQSRLWDVIINSKRLRDEEKKCRSRAAEVLDFVGLSHIGHRYIADISQEERKRVAFALAMATDPELVLLDEPAGGINPEETENLADLIRKMVKHGITVCLIEHKMDMIMSLADKIMVLDHGEKIAEGTPEQIKNDPVVIEAYLGSEQDVEA